MPNVYGRDLDLNLLRVFAVVAESGSVTEAASRLYLTQPAVSAALRRLTTTVGAPLFARSGRGLALTSRGERLRAALHPHLAALVEAALAPPTFDPKTSERTIRLGLSDAADVWLLPPLLRLLEREAPRMRVVAVPVQFRTVGAALAAGLDAAVTVADELPATIRRRELFRGRHTCLFDPRHADLGRRLSEADYFAREHVIVSYNNDLRGVVEDQLGKLRKIRCAVASFANIGAVALVEGTALLATVPEIIASHVRRMHPRLATLALPPALQLAGASMELLWPGATDDDPPGRFARDKIVAITTALARPAATATSGTRRRRSSRAS